MSQTPIKVHIQEASMRSLMLQLKEKFGGSFENKHLYTVNNEHLEGYIWILSISNGMEITLNSLNFKKHFQIVMSGESKEFARLCFRFEQKGAVMQGIKNNVGEALGLSGNMVVYDTRLNFTMDLIPNTHNQWLGIRLGQNALGFEHVSFTDYFGDVFNQNNIWWKHEIMPLEIQVQLNEAYKLMEQDLPLPVFNNRLVARGADCISLFYEKLLTRTAHKEHSLHQHDFTYMMDLKNNLLSSTERPPSLEDLSKEYGFSVSKLRRDFEQVFGTSIHKFHFNFRLEKARTLLATENKSILEISRECGFSSSTKFTEAFKKKFDITPKMVSQKYKHLH
ncbi:helix-turn-helix transcriptional regulator [Flammeovirga pacifica]|uniref:helix-turn-helix transcriptional regulator n=1 Tax=Flammeovirga pacifica TaxID=915059 RepID=UPI001A8C67CA|nr:AraC family transcriptional regulator [Flammeovirga pacifica]